MTARRAPDASDDAWHSTVPAVASEKALQPAGQRRHGVDVPGPYLGYGEYDTPETPRHLLKYLDILVKYRWLFLAAAIGAVAVGIAATLLMTPIYRASTTIEIDREAAKVVEVHNVQAGDSGSDLQFYQTEFELLKSRSLAQLVVADLNLADDPSFVSRGSLSPWAKLRQLLFGSGQAQQTPDLEARLKIAVDRAMLGLSIQPISSSRLVKLSFDSHDPARARQIANAFAESFIKANLDRRFEATAYARNFLDERLKELKLKLEESEKQLVAYAQKEQIVNVNEHQPLIVSELASINDALAKVRGERIRNEQQWLQARSTDGLGLPEILDDKTIQAMREKRAILSADYRNKLSQFKPAFPDMLKLKAEIDEVDREIKASIAVVKSSIQARYLASKNEEERLGSQLDKTKTDVLTMRSRSIGYTIIQREVDTNRTLYDGLLQRYKEVGVAGGVGTNNISIVDRAELPTSPYSPNATLNIGMALLAAMVLASAAAFLLEILDDTFKTPESVEEYLRLTVLGITPKFGRSSAKEIVLDPHCPTSEAIRSLRTALQFSTEGGVPRSLLVTSSRPSEGKSSSAFLLAANFAQLGLRILLVDGDLRNPSLHRIIGASNEAGLSNYLVGAEAADLYIDSGFPLLAFMPTGPLPPNPAELLAGPRMLSLLTSETEGRFDLVIVDGPPVIGLADALLLACVAAGTLLVVGANETRRGVAKAALKRLHFGRARMIGAVLSKYDARRVGYSYSYGQGETTYYGYGSQATPKLTVKRET